MVNAQISDSYSEFMYGAYSIFSGRYFRPIGAAPQQKDYGLQSNVNETIDSSVFERWRLVSEYRPPNLVEWATRYNASPASMKTSVMADAPQVVAPD